MSDVKTLSTTVTVPKGTPVSVAQIWGTAINALKEAGKVPQNSLPWADINVAKTDGEKQNKDERTYHVDVHYRELSDGETATADQVIASLLTPPTFDPNTEPEEGEA